MTFVKGHTLWNNENSIRTQFKKGEKNREYTRTKCEHGDRWFCVICHREDSRKSIKKNRDRVNELSRANHKRRMLDENTRESHREYHRRWSKTPAGVLKTYRRNAKDRNLVFELDLKIVEEMFYKPCFYCGDTNRTGIDRKDNDVGYIIGNIVPCCSVCNFMKSNKSASAFIKHCKDIIKYTEELGFI